MYSDLCIGAPACARGRRVERANASRAPTPSDARAKEDVGRVATRRDASGRGGGVGGGGVGVGDVAGRRGRGGAAARTDRSRSRWEGRRTRTSGRWRRFRSPFCRDGRGSRRCRRRCRKFEGERARARARRTRLWPGRRRRRKRGGRSGTPASTRWIRWRCWIHPRRTGCSCRWRRRRRERCTCRLDTACTSRRAPPSNTRARTACTRPRRLLRTFPRDSLCTKVAANVESNVDPSPVAGARHERVVFS